MYEQYRSSFPLRHPYASPCSGRGGKHTAFEDLAARIYSGSDNSTSFIILTDT